MPGVAKPAWLVGTGMCVGMQLASSYSHTLLHLHSGVAAAVRELN